MTYYKISFRGFKKMIRLYLKGAKANNFPFSKYGFFGERYKPVLKKLEEVK
jgi:hypothetical protein